MIIRFEGVLSSEVVLRRLVGERTMDVCRGWMGEGGGIEIRVSSSWEDFSESVEGDLSSVAEGALNENTVLVISVIVESEEEVERLT